MNEEPKSITTSSFDYIRDERGRPVLGKDGSWKIDLASEIKITFIPMPQFDDENPQNQQNREITKI